ncbi:MAG: STAS-like domain-containing protein [Selenomonadaceae bacterium]|nr:STAS-like domain-containing protein [Selenomonadaceae bacterium]MBR0289255.1 STAS-like domain-containing protein [Selenomonadaceae bacterium]
MVKTIVVRDYINSGFTQDDAEKISDILKAGLPKLSEGDAISFDFSNVKFFTTLFFNFAFTSLLKEMPFEEYSKKIILENLSEVGKRAYEHSLENAKRFVAMSKEERETREQIIAEILADD